MTPRQICLIGTCVFLVNGCAPAGPKNPSAAAGEYIFPAPSGEVEVVILNSDSTYLHELYADATAYRQSATPLHTNAAVWSCSRTVLTFDRWLRFFDDPNPAKRIEPPRQLISNEAHWSAPASKRDAVILISEYFHYAFLRVKNRSEGAKIIDEVSRAKR